MEIPTFYFGKRRHTLMRFAMNLCVWCVAFRESNSERAIYVSELPHPNTICGPDIWPRHMVLTEIHEYRKNMPRTHPLSFLLLPPHFSFSVSQCGYASLPRCSRRSFAAADPWKYEATSIDTKGQR